jgi:hypothetical protein
VGVYRYTVAGSDTLSPGTHTILLDFTYDGGLGKGGIVTLQVDGKEVAQGRIERTIPFRISADETLDIGEDTGTPVSEEYHVPFRFTGDLKKVAIQLTDAKLSPEDEEEIRRIKAEIGLSQCARSKRWPRGYRGPRASRQVLCSTWQCSFQRRW